MLSFSKRKLKVFAEKELWPLETQQGPVDPETDISFLNLWN